MEEFDFEFAQLEAEEQMDLALAKYELNLNKISVGRANPKLLESIKINYFGTLTPLNQLCNISVPEPRQLLIKPYDASINSSIVSAINTSNLQVNAVDEGNKTRITLPELTGERRKQLVKSLGQYTENARVKIRSIRQELNRALKNAKLPEDTTKKKLEDVQKMTDQYIQKINEITKSKEKELTTI